MMVLPIKTYIWRVFPPCLCVVVFAMVATLGLLSWQPLQFFLVICVFLISGIFLWWILQRALSPMQDLKTYIENVTEGNLKASFQKKKRTPQEILSIASTLSKLVRDFRSSQKAVIKGQIQQEVILENMDEGVISVNEEGRINHMNSSSKEILGIHMEMKEDFYVQDIVGLSSLREFIEHAAACQEKQKREIILDENKVSERVFIVRSSPIFSLKAKFRGSIFVLVDVSELRKLERHRQEFVSNASHELKTPLTSIKGYAETMQNPALQSQEHFRQFSKVIQKHADHLDSLIDNLLVLSELEKGDRISNVQWTYLEDVVKGSIEVCSQKAQDRGISIEAQHLEITEFQGNLTLLIQALVNLVDNAIKYGPKNTTVTISSRRVDNFIDLLVRDCGPGIKETQQSRLFERFYRVDKGRSRDKGGTGLGLSIVRHIMYAHGGEAGIDWTSAEGSQFYLRIPVSVERKHPNIFC